MKQSVQNCRFCDSEYPTDKRYCPRCGISRWVESCSKCGTDIDPISHFCSQCGTEHRMGLSDAQIKHVLRERGNRRTSPRLWDWYKETMPNLALSCYTVPDIPAEVYNFWCDNLELHDVVCLGIIEIIDLGDKGEFRSVLLFTNDRLHYGYYVPQTRHLFGLINAGGVTKRFVVYDQLLDYGSRLRFGSTLSPGGLFGILLGLGFVFPIHGIWQCSAIIEVLQAMKHASTCYSL